VALPWHVSSAGLSPARSWPSCCLGVKWLLCASDGAAAPDGEHGGGPLMAVAWII